jgi:hypothetical protein
MNNTKMSLLQGDEKEFSIKYLKDLEMSKAERAIRYEYSEKDIQMELDFLANSIMCEKEVKIKKGAQVMCVVNIQTDSGLEVCNGSQGIITGFCDITNCPRVKFNNGIERVMTRHIWVSDKIPGIGVSQIPLILAWALTIHKSQGATMDAAEIDVGSGIFECGQTYVALSRVKSLDGLYLTSFDVKRIRINKKVKEFYDNLSLYQSENNNDIQASIINSELIPISRQSTTSPNPFDNYKYVEPSMELSEEKYEDEKQNIINTDIKVIKLK